MSGMFCRFCHYDLRALDTPRCPECGRSFAPGDPGTFLVDLPTFRSRVLGSVRGCGCWCMEHRVAIIVFGALLWVVTAALCLPAIPRYHGSAGYHSNLKMVMTTWLIRQNDSSSQTNFDKAAARRDMMPSFSPWTEGSTAGGKWKLRTTLDGLPLFAAPTALYAGLIALLWCGRIRRVALTIVGVCVLSLVPSYCSSRISELWFPRSYAFLDDYIYVDGVKFADVANPGRTIAAYDWRTFIGDVPRFIAFADGHVDWLDEDEARALFAAQGIPYPESKELRD